MVIGVARPRSVRDGLGSRDIKRETGIRTKKAEVIPWIITGRLRPQPLKYPILLNNMQVRTQSIENPFR